MVLKSIILGIYEVINNENDIILKGGLFMRKVLIPKRVFIG